MQKSASICTAVGLLLVAGITEAALVQVDLKTVTVYGSNSRELNLATSTAAWQYDEFGHQLIQTGGVFDAAYRFTPTSTVWHHIATDMILSVGNTSASSFACVEGNFGALVNRNYCAGYSFGPNFIDESSSSWGPGLEYSRSFGGDDYAVAGIFSLEVYQGFRLVSWDGSTLLFANTGCFGGANCDGLPNGWNGGFMFSLEAVTVPVPAAVWLFGSALGVMGWMRRNVAVRSRSQPSPGVPTEYRGAYGC